MARSKRWGAVRSRYLIASMVCLHLLVMLVSAARPATAYTHHPWRFPDPSRITFKTFTSGTYKVPSWMVPFVNDGAGTWSETATPLNLTPCRSSDCSVLVRAYRYDDGNGGIGGCYSWNSSNGHCNPNQGYVWLNMGCTGDTCGSQQGTPRYDRWIVMHELGHAIGLSHTGGKHSVMSYGSCTSEAWCVARPNSDDSNGVNAKYPVDWSEDGSGAACSVIMTAQQQSGVGSAKESTVSSSSLLALATKGSEAGGQSIGKSGIDSPLNGKLTFHPTC